MDARACELKKKSRTRIWHFSAFNKCIFQRARKKNRNSTEIEMQSVAKDTANEAWKKMMERREISWRSKATSKHCKDKTIGAWKAGEICVSSKEYEQNMAEESAWNYPSVESNGNTHEPNEGINILHTPPNKRPALHVNSANKHIFLSCSGGQQLLHSRRAVCVSIIEYTFYPRACANVRARYVNVNKRKL